MILSFCQISLLLRYVHYISNPITLLLGSQRIRNNSKKMLTASIRNFYSENHPSSPCYKLNSLQKNNRRCSQIELIMSNDNIRKGFITSSGQNSVVQRSLDSFLTSSSICEIRFEWSRAKAKKKRNFKSNISKTNSQSGSLSSR